MMKMLAYEYYLSSCKEVITLCSRLSVPVNPRHLDCVIAVCSLLARKTTTSYTSTEFAAHLRA